MISMNDKIKIEMTLTRWHVLRSSLIIRAYHAEKEGDENGKRIALGLVADIDKQLKSLDFSENEKLVDDINNSIPEL